MSPRVLGFVIGHFSRDNLYIVALLLIFMVAYFKFEINKLLFIHIDGEIGKPAVAQKKYYIHQLVWQYRPYTYQQPYPLKYVDDLWENFYFALVLKIIRGMKN